jgi:hypothetical protein
MMVIVMQQNKELGALLSWAVRNGFCAHVSTESRHLIVLVKAHRQTTRIAHIRHQRPAAAALLLNNARINVLRPTTVAAHYYGDVPGVARFLKGLLLIGTRLNGRPYTPPHIDDINPLYVTETEEKNMCIFGP